MASNAIFSIALQIDDPERLRKAAEDRAVEDGLTVESWRETRKGSMDDLVMLLDPGSIPGCSVHNSSAEEA